MKTKMIFNSYIAKRLLKEFNHPIVDIKRDIKDDSGRRIIFVFEDTEKFEKDLAVATER